jgi:hypothetical protein
MAATSSGHRTAGVPQYDEYGKPITQGAAHWVVFAGVMLILLGAFQAIEGLVALFQDTYYAVRPSGLVISADYTVWGWVHLVLGVVALLTGMGLLAGNLAARVVGVCLAGISAIVNLAFIAAFPVGSTLLIAFDVVVIYAIVVHGGELKRRTR